MLNEESIGAVELKILSYLDENPHAADTVEGILQWWLLEQTIVEVRKAVELALNRLVDRNLVIKLHASDARQHYRVNADQIGEIQKLIRKQASEKTGE